MNLYKKLNDANSKWGCLAVNIKLLTMNRGAVTTLGFILVLFCEKDPLHEQNRKVFDKRTLQLSSIRTVVSSQRVRSQNDKKIRKKLELEYPRPGWAATMPLGGRRGHWQAGGLAIRRRRQCDSDGPCGPGPPEWPTRSPSLSRTRVGVSTERDMISESP